MKLSKRELKEQTEIKQLIDDIIEGKEKPTDANLDRIYNDFNIGFIGDVTAHSAYFTPLDMAADFALFAGRFGVVVDMCAGIGCISYGLTCRDYYHNNIKAIICIERNPEYVRIGKALLPHADWICGDIFDKSIWDGIREKYGRIDNIVSNPPFGKVTKTGADRSWLKYKGSDLDIAALEVAIVNSKHKPSFILPTGSCKLKDDANYYNPDPQCRKLDKLEKETGYQIRMEGMGIDTSVYSDFKNTKINVRCVDVFVDNLHLDD